MNSEAIDNSMQMLYVPRSEAKCRAVLNLASECAHADGTDAESIHFHASE